MRGGWDGRAGEGFIGTEVSRSLFVVRRSSFVLRCWPLAGSFVMGKDWWVYVLAAFCGIGAGCADVAIDDLLFTALLVVSACMVLGILRARRPWRWVIAVGVFIPLTEIAAYLVMTVKPSRAQVYGSLLAFLPGIAGAYGGSVLRTVLENLKPAK